MSYHGYIPSIQALIAQYAQVGRTFSILEIGVDRGVTLVPICITGTTLLAQKFTYVAVDVRFDTSFRLMLHYAGLFEPIVPGTLPPVQLIEDNSLNVLPTLHSVNAKFNVILIDGDHNYHTVSQELQHIEDLTHADSAVIVDDYTGRWADRDLWYANRPDYESVPNVTSPVVTDKHGVKSAVDEWLAAHPRWEGVSLLPGEPIVVRRKVTQQ